MCIYTYLYTYTYAVQSQRLQDASEDAAAAKKMAAQEKRRQTLAQKHQDTDSLKT